MTVQAILLGTAQDGGVPQVGCDCPRCTRAREVPAQRHFVVSLGLVDYATGQGWIIDATPDFREQVHLFGKVRGDHDSLPPMSHDLSGLLLTHAHIGHYTGLIHLGREAWNRSALPLYVTERMGAFLQANAPWSQLVTLGNVSLYHLEPGVEVMLTPTLHVTPLRVPHRGEWSDTVAFAVRGPNRRLFYCPDIDTWHPPPAEATPFVPDLRRFMQRFDIALLDGTFFSAEELPGRDLREIPHPLVRESAAQLAHLACDVYFIHLNHSNPLLDEGPERTWLAQLGLQVGQLGARWQL